MSRQLVTRTCSIRYKDRDFMISRIRHLEKVSGWSVRQVVTLGGEDFLVVYEHGSEDPTVVYVKDEPQF